MEQDNNNKTSEAKLAETKFNETSIELKSAESQNIRDVEDKPVAEDAHNVNLPQRISEVDLENLVHYYEKRLSSNAISFLKRKGIEMETVEKYHIGFEEPQIGFGSRQKKLGGFFTNYLVFPIYDTNGKLVDLLGQSIQDPLPQNKTLIGSVDTFFNLEVLTEEDEIILCRDVFDVLTLEQAELCAVCVPEFKVFREGHAALLAGKRVFICYPNDENSRRESNRIQTMLANVAKEVYIIYLPEGIRNINYMFTEIKNPKQRFLDLLRDSVEETIKEPVAADAKNLTLFMEEYSQRFKNEYNGIKTGFAPLDKQLLGGLRGGLYLVHGNVSSGKSMFMRQIADQIAAQEIPVVYVSWDMTMFELWARSMARILQVSTQEVLAGHIEPEEIQRANQAYKEIANYLYTIEGKVDTTLSDVEECIELITQSLGRVPVIFIDHIQRVPIRDAERRLINNMSLVSYLLHQWSRKWDVPIVVAAPREAGLQNGLSPTVEASMDVILLLESEEEKSEKKQEKVQIRVFKNRNGSLGQIAFLFDKEKAMFIPFQS
ncbi:DnaB-like helicase C-terminal domain-containing protein [Aneurinibacillus sp. Ricciae_BoGa-3]|uniref:bifunctional DNA primase/helicase n=1 Tax=Aneurinibacillus sp. Ricciae_BoGa-3 TaxID=3022697 RepID=UPI00234199A6|nr:DnaB-like helicase C-terminal domain-containing protein [Aneurinibacillus sp. Ricciae_BoGa-3]WCK56055.1 DnaB-like helicase C-terminal domain-containing protein [Aneurinibacillus sp. Ricciae_BoGa-3]